MTTEPKPKPVYLDNAGYPEPKQGIENTECPSGCFFADFYHVVHVPSCSLFQHRSGELIDEVMHRISHAEDDMQCHGYLDPVRKEIAALRAQLAENKREIAELAALVPALATKRDAREKAETEVKTWTKSFFSMTRRAERAEARVKRLAEIMEARGIHEECGGVKSGTGVVLCNCARAKEGEKR